MSRRNSLRTELFQCNASGLSLYMDARWLNGQVAVKVKIYLSNTTFWEFALVMQQDDRPQEGDPVDEIRSQLTGIERAREAPEELKRLEKGTVHTAALRRIATSFVLTIGTANSVLSVFAAGIQPGVIGEIDRVVIENTGSWGLIMEPELEPEAPGS